MTYPPIINLVTSPADSFWQLISGEKIESLHVFIRNNGRAWTEATYQSGIANRAWQYNMPLRAGTNTIDVMSALTNSVYGEISTIVTATIYLASLIPEEYSIWNCFDEFGLLLSLSRIPGEKNAAYKIRLLDVYTNPANSTYSGLRYGIARELGITYTDVTINTLVDLADPSGASNILTSEGSAIGTKLEDYADEVYTHDPIFWGNVISDESYWDSVDEETGGYAYLPHLWDPSASGLYSKWQKGGIGDKDDLWVRDLEAHYIAAVSGNAWYAHIHSGYFYAPSPSGVIGI